MTVPNLITMIRIVLTPVFVICLIDEEFSWALAIFIACGVSDGIDGMLARLFNQKSRLGTFLDPLADKIVLASAYVALAVRAFLPSWLAVMVLARDVLILLGVLVMALNRVELRVKPSIISKVTTCLQFATVIFVLSRVYGGVHTFFFYATALFTIGSGLHYIYSWFGFMGENASKSNEKNGGRGAIPIRPEDKSGQ
jgi:cardiolipin synthase (CMP-forming)